MKKILLATFLVIFLGACDDNSLSNNADPCSEVECNNHGQCLMDNNDSPFCECDQGYQWDEDNKFTCVEDADDPCEGEDCSGHGTCQVDENNDPYCECDPDYIQDYQDKLSCIYDDMLDKPVIYLYPQKTTRIRVEFSDLENLELLHSYPEYSSDGWCVTAHPDGTLYACASGLEYYALYWEGISSHKFNPATGFVIRGSNTVSFLEEKLSQLGLNRREANEFIMYWLPLLEINPWNFIHFSQQEYVQSVPMKVTPQPDSSIRFLMLYYPLEKPFPVKPQTIITPKRRGFTLVEWGGSRL
ncbi:MAG: hypothetical protein PF689_10290 [Deltaproteobacteria bacterium]|jgi:hypothetical protein|nr:hypothetical protein [Deltaproteobacteria bacterium]